MGRMSNTNHNRLQQVLPVHKVKFGLQTGYYGAFRSEKTNPKNKNKKIISALQIIIIIIFIPGKKGYF